MRKVLFSVLLVLCSIIIISSCKNFAKEAKPLFTHLDELYKISLSKCQIAHEVWRTAIYDNKYALSTSIDDYYVYDFNKAISKMEQEGVIKEINAKIDSLSSIVSFEVNKISNKKDESYNKIISLYTNVIELSKNARNPSGNLQSFTEFIRNSESEINKLITELKARNPEFNTK